MRCVRPVCVCPQGDDVVSGVSWRAPRSNLGLAPVNASVPDPGQREWERGERESSASGCGGEVERKLTPQVPLTFGRRSATWAWKMESPGLDPSFPPSVFFFSCCCRCRNARYCKRTLPTTKLFPIETSEVRYLDEVPFLCCGLAAFFDSIFAFCPVVGVCK